MQRFANDAANPLGEQIARRMGLDANDTVEWKSPVANDAYAEYRDESFLALLGLDSATMPHRLSAFWPMQGPQWDGLARTHSGKLLLIEAKSHASEIKSSCMAKSPASHAKIGQALQATQAYFKSSVPTGRWLQHHYQYANRLAHLYWLRVLNGVDAHLVFVYFANDTPMPAPLTVDGWAQEIARVHAYLGLEGVAALGFVHDMMVEVR